MILKRNIFKEKRESKELSLEELSEQLGIDSKELNKIENFEKEIDYSSLSKIKKILDINDQEVKEYFDNYYEIKSKESKAIKRSLVLNLSSLIYVLTYLPIIITDWISLNNMKFFFLVTFIGTTLLVGSYTSFVGSKGQISRKKYNIYLVIYTILFVLTLAAYIVTVLLVCNYLRYVVHI